MSPCSPTDLTVNIPAGPSGPSFPGLGASFAPSLPSFSIPFPSGFPEDLLDILDLIKLIVPSGKIQPSLSINFGKDIFDGIMSLLDKFLPFLMLYKFFLPILELIICIIEVLCAVPSPFKLAPALSKLFRVCLPDFLAMFPIFALIIMIISLLLLILALIEYIINEILKILNILLKNIRVIVKALTKADAPSILAAVNKIGMLLCGFQNIFLLLSIFNVIIKTIKDMLSLLFAIPPCSDGDNNNTQKCCTPDVCPSFIKNADGLTRTTGTLQYYNEATQGITGTLSDPILAALPPSFFQPAPARLESWQFYDTGALVPDAFWNITNAYDLPAGVTKIFFPTDATYTAGTPPNQAPYTIDLRLFYNPANYGRTDPLGARYLRVMNCIVIFAPTQNLATYNNGGQTIANGVLEIAGGSVYEDNGDTQVFIDGDNATLNNFFHSPPTITTGAPPTLSPTDGYQFTDVTYTFHIGYQTLIQKALITLGCLPSVSLDRAFVNNVYGGNAGANFTFLNNLVNGTGAPPNNVFPDIAGAQQCLANALSVLRNDISVQGVANFQASTTACLNQLGSDTSAAVQSLVGIGYDQYNSNFAITPSTQFTSRSILVQVVLNETNGQNLASSLPSSVAAGIAKQIVATTTFGEISGFVYDGSAQFEALITSPVSGSGTIQIAFDNKVISVVDIPADVTITPTITPVVLPYTFVYAPSAIPGAIGQDGVPRRDPSDIARDDAPNNDGG